MEVLEEKRTRQKPTQQTIIKNHGKSVVNIKKKEKNHSIKSNFKMESAELFCLDSYNL